MLCDCPIGSHLPDIHMSGCPENFGQIQKIIIQRRKNGSSLNTISNPDIEASWASQLSASDSTKVVQSPYLSNPEMTPGDAVKYGGGNQTINGAQIVMGQNASVFKANILSYQQRTIDDMKEIGCEDISIYFVNEYGQIGCIADDSATPTTYYGIPVIPQTFFLTDKKFGGKNEPDMNMLELSLAPGWSDKFKVITPEVGFNPLEDLSTPAS